MVAPWLVAAKTNYQLWLKTKNSVVGRGAPIFWRGTPIFYRSLRVVRARFLNLVFKDILIKIQKFGHSGNLMLVANKLRYSCFRSTTSNIDV